MKFYHIFYFSGWDLRNGMFPFDFMVFTTPLSTKFHIMKGTADLGNRGQPRTIVVSPGRYGVSGRVSAPALPNCRIRVLGEGGERERGGDGEVGERERGDGEVTKGGVGRGRKGGGRRRAREREARGGEARRGRRREGEVTRRGAEAPSPSDESKPMGFKEKQQI
jgi:hypothetical protein